MPTMPPFRLMPTLWTGSTAAYTLLDERRTDSTCVSWDD